jgi:S-DNA-T family DNA segregation ATPase FtsK/SpoIIIE
MAKSDNRKRGEKSEPPRWSNEVVGIVLICVGLLCFLSVISFTPKDLNDIGFLRDFATERAVGEERHNFIGGVGAVLGFIQVALFGAAGYIVPVALIWFGVVKLVFDGRLWPRTMVGFIILILSGAAFMHALRGGTGVDWSKHAGGLTGWLLGNHIFLPLLNRIGSLLLLGAAYLVGLILLTGQPPVKFIKGVHALILEAMANHRERKEEGRVAAEKEEIRNNERELERERRRKEREAKSAAAVPTPEPQGQQELPLRETPAPQIFDASQRKIDAPKPGDKPFERKQKGEGHLSLSTAGFEDYELPGFDLLDPDTGEEAPEANRDELLATQRTIVETLRAFGIEVTPGDITRGPTITRYEIYPSTGLRVSRIAQLEADIARATCAERINILAPIPGKDTVGIELANSQKVSVPLRELLQDPEFRSAKKKIPLALGKDVYGKTVIGDLAAMPHLLVAGATGSGKSVCINSIIASMLFKFGPDELRFIMVDPKVVEMQMYNKLPHLVVPVVTDPKKVVAALKWVVNEMEKRYRVFAKTGVRNFDSFNHRVRPEKPEVAAEEEDAPPPWNADEEVDMDAIESIAAALESGELGAEAEEDELPIEEEKIPDRYPYIVVLIDELADLMQTAPADVEMCIARIAQKARAAGIHLIIATQTPRADVVTGIIKANIPCRIAFQVSSQLDSRVILDTKGAEKLVGKGDMLYLPPGSAKLERSQGAFVSDEEVERLVDHCAAQAEPNFESDIVRSIDSGGDDGDDEEEISPADEDLIMKCIEVARQEQKCSTSLLQRRLRLGYTRAARMVDILEARGVVGPGDGAKPREVYLK